MTSKAQFRIIFLAVWLACLCSVITAQVGKLFPIDEAAQAPSFLAFRARLLNAVKMRDASFIRSILDLQILNSFGGDGGINEFMEFWKPDHPESRLWSVLLGVLQRGGAFNPQDADEFCAPYTYSNFPGLDAFEHSVITAENVLVRQQPSLNAPIITRLSYDIVLVTDFSAESIRRDGHQWVKIKLADDRIGFVSAKHLRSPIDYRACFQKKNGKWFMVTLVAGD